MRLKGGDPFVFGRGGEEALALRAAGIPFEVVPGVSSAVAAPALAGIPVTHRGLASSFVVVSGHADGVSADRRRPAAAVDHAGRPDGFGTRDAPRGALLQRAGGRTTPAACCSRRVDTAGAHWIGTLDELTRRVGADSTTPGDAPGTIVIGDVVTLAHSSARIDSAPRSSARTNRRVEPAKPEAAARACSQCHGADIMSAVDDPKTLGRTRLSFANEAEVDEFVAHARSVRARRHRPDQWRAFRLVRGTYGQRQDGVQMLRVKIPQGLMTRAQLHAFADVAERYSRGFGHITTRQNLQFHFVQLPTSSRDRALAEAGLTTREACGNSVRNITACPYAGVSADEAFDVTPYAEALTRYFLRHPLSSSLPRKFKIAFEGCAEDHALHLHQRHRLARARAATADGPSAASA